MYPKTTYIKKILRLPVLERKLLFYGIIISTIFIIITRIIPFKHYKNFLTYRNTPKVLSSESSCNYYLLVLRKTLKRISLALPWKYSCLVKGITFKLLANYLHLDCMLSINACINNQNLIAHSYITRNNSVIFLNNDKFSKSTELIKI